MHIPHHAMNSFSQTNWNCCDLPKDGNEGTQIAIARKLTKRPYRGLILSRAEVYSLRGSRLSHVASKGVPPVWAFPRMVGLHMVRLPCLPFFLQCEHWWWNLKQVFCHWAQAPAMRVSQNKVWGKLCVSSPWRITPLRALYPPNLLFMDSIFKEAYVNISQVYLWWKITNLTLKVHTFRNTPRSYHKEPSENCYRFLNFRNDRQGILKASQAMGGDTHSRVRQEACMQPHTDMASEENKGAEEWTEIQGRKHAADKEQDRGREPD